MDSTNNGFFQVSVKGLFFDADQKLLMMQEEDGKWEPPGGRVQDGEELITCLQRECLEETGLVCRVLEPQPMIVYAAPDSQGRTRIMVYYRIHFESLDFQPSDECVDMKFYTKEEIHLLKMAPQMKKLAQFL